MSAHQCWMCDDTGQFKGGPCGACLDAGRIQAPTPPAEAQVAGGGVVPEVVSVAMSEYELAAYRHGQTDENAVAVDAAANNLKIIIAALSAQPRFDETDDLTISSNCRNNALSAQPRPLPAVDEEMVRRGCEALAARWRSGVPVGPTATEDVRAVLAAALLAAQPASAPVGVEAPWQKHAADAMDSFWNPAIGAIRDASYNGQASGSDVVGAIAQGFAAVAASLRESAALAQQEVQS